MTSDTVHRPEPAHNANTTGTSSSWNVQPVPGQVLDQVQLENLRWEGNERRTVGTGTGGGGGPTNLFTTHSSSTITTATTAGSGSGSGSGAGAGAGAGQVATEAQAAQEAPQQQQEVEGVVGEEGVGGGGPPEQSTVALQKWNSSPIRIYRVLSTFFSFMILGANDAAYGVSI